MKHKVELVHNLMYKGCEPHWHCTQCDINLLKEMLGEE